MLINFFETLKKANVPVSIKELLDLLTAMEQNLAFGSVDDFYLLARTVMVKDEKYYDRFDRAFGAYFKNLENLMVLLRPYCPKTGCARSLRSTLPMKRKPRLKASVVLKS